MFRFIHAADLHLDSPLRGLERYEGAPVEAIRRAPREAFERLVAFAIEEGVSFLLLAGDLYDGDWKDYQTGLFFVRQMRRLEEAGIPVFIVAGNHDAVSQITKQLSLPKNVTLFSGGRASTEVLESHGVAIHGQSFKTRSVTEDLTDNYPACDAGYFNIGLLHTSLDGREGHANYAPTSQAALASKGYDYWALGHVHRFEEVSRDPWIVFPGNLQGRHIKETGAKGAVLVEVVEGAVQSVEHRAFSVVRWERVEVDVTDARNGLAALDRIEAALAEAARTIEETCVLRVVVVGASAAHGELHAEHERWTNEVRSLATALGAGEFYVEKLALETEPARGTALDFERDDALGELLGRIEGLQAGREEVGSQVLADWRGALADLSKKLPAAMREDDAVLDLSSEHSLRSLLPDVRELLLARLADVDGRS